MSLSTVKRIRKSMRNRPPPAKRGRPKLIDDRLRRIILRKFFARELDTPVDAALWLDETGLAKASLKTISRIFYDVGLNARTPRKKPLLSRENIDKRIAFARDHSDVTPRGWEDVIWSDESLFTVLGRGKKRKVWRRAGEELDPRNIQPTLSGGGQRIMVWGCFTSKGPGRLIRIIGRLKADGYINILNEGLLGTLRDQRLLRRNVRFMQDNDPKHTAIITKQWLSDKHFRMLQCPPQSPDLNPIENMWGRLKQKLAEYERFAKNSNELWERLQVAWKEITVDYCLNLIHSMPRRLDAVLKAKGLHTKY